LFVSCSLYSVGTVTPKGAVIVAEALKVNRMLKRLNLESTQWCGVGFLILTSSVASTVGDADILAMADMLRVNRTLQCLSLGIGMGCWCCTD
jgi:hypothetical protein